MGRLEDLQAIEYLGGEFLTWLVVSTAREEGPAEWGECQPVQIEITGPMALEGPGMGALQVNLRGEELLEAPELRAALAEGKRLRKLKLAFNLEEERWEGTLDARTLEWRGLKVSVPNIPDMGEYLLMRTQAFERASRMLDEWFAAFLRRRLDAETWDGEVAKIRSFATEPADASD